jgi:inner membrane transporter RhtA
MARLSRGTYALMVLLLPAVATVGGLVVLAEPSLRDASGLALVFAGVALHRPSRARR